MNHKQMFHTSKAPDAIGTYSQAIVSGKTVYLSGQIPLDPETMEIVEENIHAQIRQIFRNLMMVCEAAGGSLEHIVKLTVYLTHLKNFQAVNDIMTEFFSKPYPARVLLGVSELPRGASVEIDGIMVLE